MTTSQAVTFPLTALTWAPRADRSTLRSEFHQHRTKLFYPTVRFLWSCHITYAALLQASFHHLHLAQRELSNLVFTCSYANITIHNTQRVAFSYTATILVIAAGTVRGPPASDEKHSPTKVTGTRTRTTNCHQHQEAADASFWASCRTSSFPWQRLVLPVPGPAELQHWLGWRAGSEQQRQAP